MPRVSVRPGATLHHSAHLDSGAEDRGGTGEPQRRGMSAPDPVPRTDNEHPREPEQGREDREGSQPHPQPGGVARHSAEDDGERGRGEVPAEQPAEHQIERGQPAGVPGRRRMRVPHRQRDLRRGGRGPYRLGDQIGRTGCRRPGHGQPQPVAGRVGGEDRVHLAVVQRLVGRVRSVVGPGGQSATTLTDRAEQRLRTEVAVDHRDRYAVRRRLVQRPDIGGDERDTDREYPHQQPARPRQPAQARMRNLVLRYVPQVPHEPAGAVAGRPAVAGRFRARGGEFADRTQLVVGGDRRLVQPGIRPDRAVLQIMHIRQGMPLSSSARFVQRSGTGQP